MIVKKHINEKAQVLLAICDSDLIGKKFEDEKLHLDLTSNFYKGEEMSEEKILELIEETYIINAVGKKTIEFLKKNELVQEEHIILIDNIPHAQIAINRN